MSFDKFGHQSPILAGGSFTSLSIIANLPESCRPTKRLTFNLNHHDYTHSVDVTPDGSVVWMAGTAKYTWVSLTGITFAPGDLGRITLPLLNGTLPFAQLVFVFTGCHWELMLLSTRDSGSMW